MLGDDSGKYLPAALSTDNVKISDQLEKAPERLKVNKVWHRAVLKAVSISWVCTLSSPLGYLDSNSNMRHAHTSTRTQTHIHKNIRNVVSSSVADICSHLYQHTVIPNVIRPRLMEILKLICQFIENIKQSVSCELWLSCCLYGAYQGRK